MYRVMQTSNVSLGKTAIRGEQELSLAWPHRGEQISKLVGFRSLLRYWMKLGDFRVENREEVWGAHVGNREN